MINLHRAKEHIAILNKDLQEEHPNLSLELGLYSEFKKRKNVSIYENMKNPQIVLCLNENTIEKDGSLSVRCISSIASKILKTSKSIEIYSKTHAEHEGKKYNTLLRSVMLLVASEIEYRTTQNSSKSRRRTASSKTSKTIKTVSKIKTSPTHTISSVVSHSINPISTLLLVKYFNATNSEMEEYLEENNIDKQTLTLEQVKDFQEEDTDSMTFSQELRYMKKNESFGNPLLLTVNLSDRATMKIIKDTFNSTLKKIPLSKSHHSHTPHHK